MPPATRRFLGDLAKAFVVAYVVVVGVWAALKQWFGDEPPFGIKSSWAEVFYGPALTFICVFLLIVVAVWLEGRIAVWSERRKEQKP